ncbi:hypothetical protein HY993_02025 [Candidatus Micrarchaeota archaeon]|nr:hypothetical protein [Candidatus Micrarchaeota archaeon]
MGWLETLKGIFNVEINSPILQISFVNNSNNKNEVKGNPYFFDKASKKLYLNLDKLPVSQHPKLKESIKGYLEEGNTLLQTETAELLQKLYNYNKETTNKQILEFFKPNIPVQDYDALEASLYLRDTFRRREDVQKLKLDIREIFGNRGNNICNLCTAGYFEKFLVPLFNSSKERFNELYEIIVGKAVLAVFVHQSMGDEEITSQIKNKLEISRKYGIKFIHIHGIGEQNIRKIKECLEKQKAFFGFFEKNIFEQDNILILELLLK